MQRSEGEELEQEWESPSLTLLDEEKKLQEYGQNVIITNRLNLYEAVVKGDQHQNICFQMSVTLGENQKKKESRS